MVKLKMKQGIKVPKQLPYQEGANKIASDVDNFVANCLEKLDETHCKSYLDSEGFRKSGSRISDIIDEENVAIMKAIRNSNILQTPFEYVMWGVMQKTTPLVKDKDKDFYRLNSIACRLIDTHYYYANAKSKGGENEYVTELIKRGWYGKDAKENLQKHF